MVLLEPLFAACNDTYCPRKVFCHKQSMLVKLKNAVVWVDNHRCRSNNYQDFVPVTDEELGITIGGKNGNKAAL